MAVEPAGVDRLRAVPAPPADGIDSNARARAILRWGMCAVLLWAPLPFASVQPWAVLAIEICAAVLAAIAFGIVARGGRDERPSLLIASLAGALILTGVFQILPLFSSTAPVPGAAERPSIAAFIPEAVPSRVPWSASVAETVDATVRLGAYVLFGLIATVAVRTRRHALDVAVVIVIGALFQSIYGCAEYLSGSNAIFGFAKQHYVDCATGTFINPNHFAGALALAMPFAFATTSELRSSAKGASRRVIRTAIGAAAIVMLWVGVLLSHSRSGLAVSLLAVAIYVAAAGIRGRVLRGIAVLLTLAVTFAMWNDVRLPGERFAQLSEDLSHPAGRLAVWREALAMTRDSAGLGYGLGTFDTVYGERTALVHSSGRYDHAHNDHVQAILEAGLPAYVVFAALIAAAAAPAMRRRRESLLAAASIASASALALHGLVDFPIRIPALALVGSVLVGTLAMQRHPSRLLARPSFGLRAGSAS